MSGKWYSGPFRITHPERSVRPRDRGEITQHRTGGGIAIDSYFLRCPACGAMTTIVGQPQGTDDKPTFPLPLQCGCRIRCGETFRIRHGTAERQEEPPAPIPSPEIPEPLAKMGVTYPKVVNPK